MHKKKEKKKSKTKKKYPRQRRKLSTADSLRLLHMDGRFCKSFSSLLFPLSLSGQRRQLWDSGSRRINCFPGARSCCHLLQKPCVIQREGQPLPGAGEPSLPSHCDALCRVACGRRGGRPGGEAGRPRTIPIGSQYHGQHQDASGGEGRPLTPDRTGEVIGWLQQRKEEARVEEPGRFCQTAYGPPRCTLMLILSNEL